jgi:hypothetical protein
MIFKKKNKTGNGMGTDILNRLRKASRVMWIPKKMALQPQSIGCENAQVDHAQPISILQVRMS